MSYLRPLVLSLLILAVTLPAQAGIARLQAEGHLETTSALAPTGEIVPGQKLKLTLEIATDTWFGGGTRIAIPEIPGLVILQTEQFASNSSESRKGQPWVVQRWTLDVFPQRPGEFSIGALPMTVTIAGGDAGNVQGTLSSAPVSFQVNLPAALEQAEFWVAAPEFTVDESFDKPLESLAPGDAFERRVAFAASDVTAMMLPTFSEAEIDGLAAYPAPPVLENSSNRGDALATRIQTISYVVQSPGSYLLPAQDFFWWNTRSSELEIISLPATEILVAGSAGSGRADTAPLLQPRQWLLLVAVILGFTLSGWLFWRFQPWNKIPALLLPLKQALHYLQELRKPALPARLNPDSNAGD